MAEGWLWFYWPFVLAFIALVLFAIPEAIAFRNKTAGPTFSRFMWTMHQKWPPWTFLWGMLIGGLMVHFLWHWNPECNPTITGHYIMEYVNAIFYN